MNCTSEPSIAGAPPSALAAFAQPLQRERIVRALAGACEPVDVATVRETGSTNSDLLALARAGQPQQPLLRAALVQTAGRGRYGRRWHSSAGAALLFSLAVPLADSAHAPAAITLACGVAIAECLSADAVRVQLKWPNDVLLDGRKLAGILCELAQDGAGRRTLVIGVGINLWADAAMRASAVQPLAALAERIELAQLAATREARIAQLARALLELAREYERDGFVPLQPRYMRWFASTDAEVEMVEHGALAARGRALGVDGAGRLLLQTRDGLRAFASGELSLRIAKP